MEPRHLAASARCHVEVRLRDDAGVPRVVRDIISGVKRPDRPCLRSTCHDPGRHPGTGGHDVSRRRAFGEGFLCDLSNPKTVLVYASVIPQFLTASNSPSGAFVLGVIFALLGFLSLLVYALVFSAAGAFLSNGRLMRNLLRGSGGILVFCGAGLLLDRPSH